MRRFWLGVYALGCFIALLDVLFVISNVALHRWHLLPSDVSVGLVAAALIGGARRGLK